MSSDRKTFNLTGLIVGGLSIWAVVCFFIHGPAIAAYLAIQAVTSGVFAWEMRRIERVAAQQKAARVEAAKLTGAVPDAQAAA
jgi:hypothetical protein